MDDDVKRRMMERGVAWTIGRHVVASVVENSTYPMGKDMR